MSDSLWDALFGATVFTGTMRQQNAAQAELAAFWADWYYNLPTRTIPAGITWERTGPRTHRVTIRREPEVIRISPLIEC